MYSTVQLVDWLYTCTVCTVQFVGMWDSADKIEYYEVDMIQLVFLLYCFRYFAASQDGIVLTISYEGIFRISGAGLS